MTSLLDRWWLGPLQVPNRVALAPLAGIGNWFVRLQAKRYGAGLMVSEMVSSFAVHYGNPRTCTEMLRIDPRERADGALVSVQLFGSDPEVMRSAAARVAEAGADLIDLNMGCPVPKVCKTGAGAALLGEPGRAVAVATAAREGSGLPVTVKLRSGQRPGDTDGFGLAQRLVADAGVSAIAFHPRSAAVHHRGAPDYALVARLVECLGAPVILTGGLSDAAAVRDAVERTGAQAVMLARGCLGNPWLFEELVGGRRLAPTREEILDELDWVIECAVEHIGVERAGGYLRKFYPWYVARLDLDRESTARLLRTLQSSDGVPEARAELLELRACEPVAA